MAHIAVDIRSLLNFVLQLTVLSVLLVGFFFARKRNFRVHEKCMTAALIMGAISFFSWMAVSFIIYFDIVVREFYSGGVIITVIHVLTGSSAGVLAVYNVLNVKEKLPQRLRSENVLRTMRLTFAVWVSAFFLGTSFYVYYFIL